ncbi:DUF2116 family Zn-ribbon domain-containing protein [Botryobacter ruber]|uniref:DUF2116 family Zn-ribbon domain-containing protein n=1 Tax=Botryobacter ruber TaxID=2171629 RepID=UPI000E0CBA9D|nr:DUF2116 family Zn-ribbon domain-containing protein [Botryobacter ruber]
MEQENKVCQSCGTGITGRADKRFCSDQCRATYTNIRKKGDESEALMRHINQVLRRNRNILRQASPNGKTTLRRSVLEIAGFDFRYFTHLYRTKQGNTYYLCYDYGYLLLDEDKVLIVNHQPYMDGKS